MQPDISAMVFGVSSPQPLYVLVSLRYCVTANKNALTLPGRSFDRDSTELTMLLGKYRLCQGFHSRVEKNNL
jgi:hypothetical protein